MTASDHSRRSILRGLSLALTLAALLILSHGIIDDATAPASTEIAPARVAQSTVPGMPENWWAQTRETLAQREYQVTPEAGVLQAPNRRHGLRTWFRPEGLEIAPREGRDPWRWSWTTVGFGREQLTSVAQSHPRAQVIRVDYDRPGLREWYVNRKQGLEQGFTVTERPVGEGMLRIVGRWESDLSPKPAENGVDFVNASGAAVLRYDELMTWDATGRELPAEIVLAGHQLTLSIDDRDAVYPLTVDPVVTSPPWIVEGSQYRGYLGEVFAPAGDVNGDGFGDIIVGSPDYTTNGINYYGHAFLFYGSADGPAATPAWEFRGEVDGAEFGASVASAGDVNGDGYDDIIVGEPGWDDSAIFDAGRVWIWYGSADGLDPDEADDYFREDLGYDFGRTVGCAGDVNGDGFDDVFMTNPGIERINIAYGSAGGVGPYETDWHYTATSGNTFADAASCAGDVNGDGYDDLVVGEYYYSSGVYTQGAIHMFYGGSSGLGDPVRIASAVEYLYMGYSVSMAGDIDGDGYGDVLVGCPTDPGDFCTEPPHLRVYRGGATGLETTPAWQIDSDTEYHVASEAICGGDANGDGYADVIVRQTYYNDDEQYIHRVNLHLGYYDGLSTEAIWSVDAEPDEGFDGVNSIGDVNGDGFCDIAIGDVAHNVDRGRIFCYPGGSEGPRNTAGWVTESNQAEAEYGFAVATAGDVNGDGFDDVLVGAPYYDNGQIDEGAVFLFLGSNQGLGWVPLWWAEGNQAGCELGYAVASAGDVNGDGLPDVIVGAPGFEVGGVTEGGAFVWHSDLDGVPFGNPDNADWKAASGQANALFGCSVDGAGDVNGDGYSDVIIGAYQYDNGTTNEGGVWIHHGSAGGLSLAHDWFHDTNHGASGYGFSVSSAGDMNGDGYSDVIIGAPFYDHPGSDEGLVFVYLGGEDGIVPGAPWWYAQANQTDAYLGRSVDTAGDVNGDGYSDVICGAPRWDGIAANAGAVMLWHGGPTPPPSGTPDNADWAIYWLVEDGKLGQSVAAAGDLNGDGYGDVVAGCPWNTGPNLNDGFALAYLGSPDGIVSGFDWLVGGTQSYELFGCAVSSAGDVNGDGFSDLLIGAKRHSSGQGFEGRAHIFYGNDGRGLPRSPRQWHDNLTDRLAPLGRSSSQTGFGLTARGRTAAGRGDVRLEYEVKPFGTHFDGNGIVLADGWTDTGAPLANGGSSATLSATVSGLTSATGYHWRLRVRSDNAYFPGTPWLSLSWNGATELDLRTGGGAVGVGDHEVPVFTAHLSNHPNPFNPQTVVRYAVPEAGPVRLSVYDPRGRLVRTLVNEDLPAGSREAVWKGEDDGGRRVASGVYLAVLETAGGTLSHKLSLVK